MAQKRKVTFFLKNNILNFEHATCTHNTKCANSNQTDYWDNGRKKRKKKDFILISISRHLRLCSHILFYFISSIFLFVRSFSLCLYPVLVHLFLFEHLLLANWPIVNNPKIHNKLAVQSKHQSKLSDAKKFTCWVFSKSLHNFLPPLLVPNTFKFIHLLLISLKLYYDKRRAFHCPILLC
jgi:hypothetical protein